MTKININDALNLADDKFIETAINVDSPQKFKEITMKENTQNKSKIIKMFTSIAACICLVLVAVVAINSLTSSKSNDLIQITNPITEVESADEMKDYLGYDVPVIDGQDVESYTVIGDGNYAQHGRIEYSNGGQFDVEKAVNTDVSGIYGATLEKTQTIDSVNVSLYEFEGTYYTVWSYSDYSYSYSDDSESDTMTATQTLISQITAES